MRIFQALEFNQFSTGSVHQMFQAAEGLAARGHEVHVVSRPSEALADACKRAGVLFHPLPMRHQFDLASVRRLRLLFQKLPPDVIHVHKGTAHSLALMASWRHPAGAFVVNRGVSFELDFWNRMKYRTRRVDRVVTVCQQNADVVIESGGLPPEKVEVIFAGTDVHEFDPARWNRAAFRNEKGIPLDRFLIAQVGIRDWKGWKELIDSMSDVLRDHPHAHLALIGCKHEGDAAEVRAYAASASISEHVTAVEVRRDMPSVFAACDLVVDASWAGTGITGTIREAMAMEKPTISTDAGGNVELVSSPEVGWLIPMKNRAALSNAILEVMSNPERAATVGKNARNHVVQGFSRDLRISRLESLYLRILGEKKR
jgi:glycosyltransferase involved in cell wall biosynthesis